MKKRHFDVETDGFYGAYWKCKTGSDCAMIAMIGDDSEDYLARHNFKSCSCHNICLMVLDERSRYSVLRLRE